MKTKHVLIDEVFSFRLIQAQITHRFLLFNVETFASTYLHPLVLQWVGNQRNSREAEIRLGGHTRTETQ